MLATRSSYTVWISKSGDADDLLLQFQAGCRLDFIILGEVGFLDRAATPNLSAQDVTETAKLYKDRLDSLFFPVHVDQTRTLPTAPGPHLDPE
ncbi:hypothetical protein K4K54_002007 [Colletotrichum sp. SAR 10_86]|nr:hypothetical protein K4K54_002007 [Colletotrichum sp. SAR 10_86]